MLLLLLLLQLMLLLSHPCARELLKPVVCTPPPQDNESLHRFLSSKGARDFVGFVLSLNEAVTGGC